MTHNRKLTLIWLFLVALTLAGGYLGETADPGLAITLVVATVVFVKGRLVMDHFMELKEANRRIRQLMYTYFYLLPLIIIAVHIFGENIARWTAI